MLVFKTGKLYVLLVAFVDNYREERRMWNATDDGLEEYVFSRDIQQNSVLCLLVWDLVLVTKHLEDIGLYSCEN